MLWVPGDRDASFQYWERIGNVIRGEISSEEGLLRHRGDRGAGQAAAASGLGRLFKGLRRSSKNRDFLLPDGSSSEQCGERRTDLLLVWSPTPRPRSTNRAIQSAWPQAKRVRRLRKELFLVSGVETRSATSRRAARGAPTRAIDRGQPQGTGRGFSLAAARKAGDRAAEATALADLGVTQLSEGDPAGAVAVARIGARDRSRARATASAKSTSSAIWAWRCWASGRPRRRGRCSSTAWHSPEPSAITWAKKPRWSAWGSLTGISASSRPR